MIKTLAFFNNKCGVSKTLLDEQTTPYTIDDDPHCLGIMRQYQSLMPLAQEAQKPMFGLRPGDGAIGAHSKGPRNNRLAPRRCEPVADRERARSDRPSRSSATATEGART